MLDKIRSIASSIQIKTAGFTPQVAIVLGSGLSELASRVLVHCTIAYSEIEGFPVSTVAGHKGNLIFGSLAGKNVVVMQGRFHYYEGYSLQDVVLPIRVMKMLGASTLMLSNAAGALNMGYKCGDMMLITDHINFIPNPLIGSNDNNLGTRFPAMDGAYSVRLGELALKQAKLLGLLLRHGCYVAVTGPSYETPSEVRFYRTIGGDAVGMSTAPEVIAAKHAGMDVIAVSLITNEVRSAGAPELSHAEVVKAGADGSAKMGALFSSIIEAL